MSINNIFLLLVPEESNFYLTKKNIPPLSLGILQGYLSSKNFRVTIKDLNPNFAKINNKNTFGKWSLLFDKNFVFDNLKGKTSRELQELIGSLIANLDFSDIDAIGISTGSGISLWESHFSFLLGKVIKEKYNKPIVFGGLNVSYLFLFKEIFKEFWQLILENFKYVFLGPGEKPFEQLLKIFQKGDSENEYYNIDGAIYYKNGELVSNGYGIPSFVCPDFSGLELKAYSTIINLENKKLNEIHYIKWAYPYNILAHRINKSKSALYKNKEVVFLPYFFNHYCPYNCAFCEQSDLKKRNFCSKSADLVIRDLQHLSKEYDTNYFHFVDNTFNYTPSFVREFCAGIINNRIEIYWSDCARCNNLTEELLELMYKAGCRRLVFGFETGSPKLLRNINKKLDIDQLKNVLTLCNKIGIWAELEVIVGFPYEFEEDFQHTYNFIKENKNLINYFHLNKYYVVPTSLMGTYPEKYGMELIRIQNYEDLLVRNKQLFENGYNSKEDDRGDFNFHIFSYNEKNGRVFTEILKDTKEKYIKMYDLQQSFTSVKEAQLYINSNKILLT